MLRYIVTILLSVLALTFLRSVLGLIFKAIGTLFHEEQAVQPQGRPSESIPAAQVLRKCQGCGTYMPESTMLRRNGGKEPAFYCSANCRDRKTA
jgi:hypothetical protein